jgi:hypothetical protein
MRNEKGAVVKRIFLIIVLVTTILSANGCVYTNVTMPLSTELNKADLGHKQGESSMYSILWLFAWGDAGQARAAQSGGVTVITHMDREMQVILFGLYSRVTTIVYGD